MIAQKVEIANYNGEADPTILIPRTGTSFQETPDFQEIVDLLKHWQYKSAMDLLDENIQTGAHLIDSLLLKSEILAMWEDNEEAIHVLKEALLHAPHNLYANCMIIIQLLIAQGSDEEINHYYEELKRLSPTIHDELKELMTFVDQNKSKFEFREIDAPLDLICVFGSFLNEDGSIPSSLQKRLNKTYELAKEHPNAVILLSGGAVHNRHSEAIEMKKYLESVGIDAERLVPLTQAKDTAGNVMEFLEYIEKGDYHHICMVSSLIHLPRAWMTLFVGLKQIGHGADLYCAASAEKIEADALAREMSYSYQTVSRIAGFFIKQDIEDRLLS